jgi:aspartyl-tRNA(Asn)/glutamyl-tRNA(Gln) amidotransferase subunit B
MRTKETSDDYRYFPDPDLLPLNLTWLETSPTPSVSRHALFAELISQDISADAIHTVLNDPQRREFLLALRQQSNKPAVEKLAIQWINQEPVIMQFTAGEVSDALEMVASQTIRSSLFKESLLQAKPGELLETIHVKQSDATIDNLDEVVTDVLAQYPEQVMLYKQGQVQLLGFFVGQVRKALQGKGDPAEITDALKSKLN